MSRPSLVVTAGSIADLARAARLAEEAGFESVWSTEFYDRSATIGAAAMAQATRELGLGTAIAYAFGRTPLVLAAEARDLDELSAGRIILGLGNGTATMMSTHTQVGIRSSSVDFASSRPQSRGRTPGAS